MLCRQLPGFVAVVVLLRAETPVEQPVRGHRRIDQHGLQAVALGQVGRIVAAQGAADQHWAAQLGDGRFELANGLARMVVQGRHPQALGKPQALHERTELARLVRRGRTVESVDIEEAGLGAGHAASWQIEGKLYFLPCRGQKVNNP
ncbi:hypothetical protein D3C72_1853960 [compost metagenome]